jgi:hypothetical protein
MSDWIKCSDKMPLSREYVLIKECSFIEIGVWEEPLNKWYVISRLMGQHARCYPTHWMPLPEPPQE